MSALKFTCPVCGQNMQCEKAYVGHQAPCPSCGADLRVPASDAAGGAPDALPRAELVNPTAAPILATIKKAAASEIPQEMIVAKESDFKKPAPPPHSAIKPEEIHCLCPVCQSELKVSADAIPGPGGIRHAELVRATPPHDAESHSTPAGQSPIEREQEIAAARAAHPVEVTPAIKPRLSYILSGGEAPSEPAEKPETPSAETRTE